MATGTVKWLTAEQRFGFIASDGAGDTFAHYSAIAGPVTGRSPEDARFADETVRSRPY